MRRFPAPTLLIAALVFIALPAQFADAKPKAAAKKAAPAKKEKKTPEPATDPVTSEPSASANGAPPPTRGPTRLDFDDRLIQGQTNKSGAVYLYDRKELKTRSMIKTRESFRDEIITTVYDG